MIKMKRVYEAVEATDGERFLVDRLWPRGVRKESLAMRAWCREAAPSNELRLWYHHDPGRWEEFRRRYFAELRSRPDSWSPLLKAAREGTVTLIYSAQHADHNNAAALKEFMEDQLEGKKKRQG
jgi:uncharacterized protein YeaO (DUF488 family)